MTNVTIGGRVVDEELALCYSDYLWVDQGLSMKTQGQTFRRESSRRDVHQEILDKLGLELGSTEEAAFTKALLQWAEKKKPRWAGE